MKGLSIPLSTRIFLVGVNLPLHPYIIVDLMFLDSVDGLQVN
jgi:hypothetical protein